MKLKFISRHPALVWLVLFCSCLPGTAATIKLTSEKTGAVYQPGEKIIWHITVDEDDAASIKAVTYTLKRGGQVMMGQGMIALTNGAGVLTTSLTEPGTVLAEVTATNADQDAGQNLHALAGAAVAPDQLRPSLPCPDDFDAFWKAQLAALAAVPENAVLKPESSGMAQVAYWKVTLDNIRGTHIQGQLARPVTGKKLPAMVVFQWAGVYPLKKEWVTTHAAEGWLVLNIMAHDLPIDRPRAFYDQQAATTLSRYPAIGDDDRDRSYFLRMLLACSRAVDYLSERPDWDGRTLIVTGTSQGGLQSFAAAALNPKVTGVLVLVPAGCDNAGGLAGRKPGWPYWLADGGDRDEKKVLATSRYFDGVNFAARIKCPALVGVGLIDTTAPPSGVFTAYNQIQGPKEIVVMPDSDHQGHGHAQAPFGAKAAVWRQALLAGKTIPPR